MNKINLILVIQDQKRRDLIYTVASRAGYNAVAKYRNVAWAQLYNIPEEERSGYEIRILVDTYLVYKKNKRNQEVMDYTVYQDLLGMVKWVITHGMDCVVTIQDTLDTFKFESVTDRKFVGIQTKTYQTAYSWGVKDVRIETTLGSSTWDAVEETLSPLKRLHDIYTHYSQEEKHKTEFSKALLEVSETVSDTQELWEFCKIYGPAYGLDPIYMPITRDSVPREWLKQNPGRMPLDEIHDEKARLSRVLQTLPIEYEAQVRTQYDQIRFYQEHPQDFPWLPEYGACPECGRPVNMRPFAHLDTCSGMISGEDNLPQCLYCSTILDLERA